MDSDLLSLIILTGMGVFFLLGLFVLPYRKLQEEKNQTPLHTERCSAYWRAFGGHLYQLVFCQREFPFMLIFLLTSMGADSIDC